MLGIEWWLLYLVLGGLVGFLAGLLGVGGGGVLVPILTIVFLAQGVDEAFVIHLALGTSMACMVFTTFSSALAHHAKNAVLWNVVRFMSPGIVCGAFLSTFIVTFLDAFLLSIIYVCIMVFVSVQMLKNKSLKPKKSLAGPVGLSAVGLMTGAISSMVAMGGGFITVAYLTLCNQDIKKAIGTSSAVALPVSIAGTLGYVFNGWSISGLSGSSIGFIDYWAVVLISITSFLTAPAGAKFAHILPADLLKKCFVLLTLALSLKMLWSLI